MPIAILAACTNVPDQTVRQPATEAPSLTIQSRIPSVANTPFGRQIADAVMLSPAIAGEAASVAQAEAELRGAQGAFRPYVSVGLSTQSYTSTGLRDFDISPVAELTQLVYDGGASRARIAQASANIERSNDERVATASATTLLAVETYLNVLVLRELLIAADRTVTAHEELRDRIAERADVGAGIQTDILTARSRLADAHALQISVRADLAYAEAAYAEIFDHDPPLDLARPTAAPPLPDEVPEVLAHRSPRWRVASANIAVLEAGLATARAGRGPQVSLQTSAGLDDDDDVDIALGLVVDYPIYSQGRAAAAIDAAMAQLNAARAESAALERTLVRELVSIISDRGTNAAQVEAARNAADANAATLAALTEQFQIGRSSLLDVLDAESATFAAQQALILTQNERALTGWAALAITGDILAAFEIASFEGGSMP